MNRLLLIGLNHTTAPLDVRERLSFNAQQRNDAIDRFKASFPNCEIVLLSTCNRVELYLAREVHGSPRVDELMQFMSQFHQLPEAEFEPHVYQKSDREMVDHLFRVASSLDSMVLGETQILGQVREAYEACNHVAGRFLNPLFQRALAVGKQVMHGTWHSEGRLSVASVAVDYAKGIFDSFRDKTVLCIGAGKMTALVLKHFAELSPGRLLICNRDQSKAQALTERFGGEAVGFDVLDDHLVAADIVISSTGATHPIITKRQIETLRRKRRYRPLFLIDIAVPRDIESAVGEIDGVYLYNLDDLQDVVSRTQAGRKDVIAAADKIISAQVEEFVSWSRQRELGPAIRALYNRYHVVAQEEVARTINKLPNLSDAEKAHLEDLSRRIVNKLLHNPIHALKNSDSSHTQGAQYLHALEKLFHLGADDLPPEEPKAEQD